MIYCVSFWKKMDFSNFGFLCFFNVFNTFSVYSWMSRSANVLAKWQIKSKVKQ